MTTIADEVFRELSEAVIEGIKHEQLVDAQRQANTLVADKVRLTKELKRAQTSLALRNQQFSSAAQEGRRAGKRHINSTKGKKK